MQSCNLDKKRKALTDITNIYNKDVGNNEQNEDRQRWAKFDESHCFFGTYQRSKQNKTIYCHNPQCNLVI